MFRNGWYIISWLVLLVHVSSAIAGEFHSTSYGYRLDVPNGWVEIPPDVLQDTLAAIQKQNSSTTIIYDAGFQPDSSNQWLEYPYVLVQALPYSRYGIHRQLNEDEFPKFVRKMTGLDLEEIVDKNLNEEARQLLREIELEQPILDSANRRFLWTMNIDVQGIGPVRALLVGHFGRDSIVQVTFYSRSSEWDHYAAARQAIVDSFRFDPNKAYSVALGASSAGESTIWSGALERGVRGAILGAILGAITGGIAASKKKSQKLNNMTGLLIILAAVLVFVAVGVMAALR